LEIVGKSYWKRWKTYEKTWYREIWENVGRCIAWCLLWGRWSHISLLVFNTKTRPKSDETYGDPRVFMTIQICARTKASQGNCSYFEGFEMFIFGTSSSTLNIHIYIYTYIYTHIYIYTYIYINTGYWISFTVVIEAISQQFVGAIPLLFVYRHVFSSQLHSKVQMGNHG
jgi:hypothetical protein